MKIAKFFLASLLIALPSGCVTKIAHTTPFNLSDLEPYAQKGTAKIYGQAFLTTKGGDVKYGAGRTVSLIPATAFVRETRAIRDRGAAAVSMTADVAAQLNKYVREAIADGQGNFEFTDLPAGDYLVETKITWLVTAYQSTGGLVSAYVTVKEGETQKVVLTQ